MEEHFEANSADMLVFTKSGSQPFADNASYKYTADCFKYGNYILMFYSREDSDGGSFT